MEPNLYPLRFEPIFKKALWGGRQLGEFLQRPLPDADPVGEAWVLSDQGDNLSWVADGPLAGRTLRSLLESDADVILGRHAGRRPRFPLLLKFIDAQLPLSVQVHPHDRHVHLIPEGDCGKTEAWVVLCADPGSCIYAGLKPGVGPGDVQRSLAEGTIAELLHRFEPQPGDCVFLPAGTVHALGGGVLIFEVQQTSDVTFRLHDWNRVDSKTGKPRALHIDQALACIDYDGARLRLPMSLNPFPGRQRLVSCEYFTLDRIQAVEPFSVGAVDSCRILIALQGGAKVEYQLNQYAFSCGEALLLPAILGECVCWPGKNSTLLECGLPT